MTKEFLRQDISRHSKIGKNRKKLQKWRRPKGRDSKMRLKRKSYPKTVSIGYGSPRTTSGKIEGNTPVLVYNMKDLQQITSGQSAIVAKIGAKKKMELIKFATENKIKLLNIKESKNETRK